MNQEEIDAYWAEVKPVVPVQLEFRLHYNDVGQIYMCTMQQHPESDQYIVVDRKTYDNYFKYRVVNGKLKECISDSGYQRQLVKSTMGFPVVAGHAGLIIEPNETYLNIEYYGRKTNN